MEELTVGDIRPLLDLAVNSPILDDSQSIAAQLRDIISNLGVPITEELNTALSLIEANPILVDAGIAEFRSAIEALPDSTPLSEVEGFGPGTSGGNQGDGDAPGDGGISKGTQDIYGNDIQTFTLPFSETQITISGETVTVTLPDGEAQQLIGVDRLEFTDGTFFVDVDDGAGLVKAAYEKLLGTNTPDAEGFDFWLNLFEANKIDEFALTEAFSNTDAFDTKYGQFLENAEDLVLAFYQDLFNRTADQAGLEFWVGGLEANGVSETVDDVLGYMLQSDEFSEIVGSNYADGFFV